MQIRSLLLNNHLHNHKTTYKQQVLPKVIWKECVALAQLCKKVPICYNGMPQIHTKTAPSPSMITTRSNKPVPRLIPLTTPNGIRIQSAIRHNTLSRQTDRWDRRQLCTDSAWAHALRIVNAALISITLIPQSTPIFQVPWI